MPVNKIRRNGSYAPLSAHYYKDDAIDEAGLDAELLYVRGLAFCADVLSDGFISDRQLVRFVGVGMPDAVQRAERLVAVELWERTDGGYLVRSWLEWNRSREEITEHQAKDRARKSRSTPQEESERPDPEPPNGPDRPSERIPNGSHAESDDTAERSPNGFQPRAGARARPPRNSTPRNSTPSHTTQRRPTAAAAEPRAPRAERALDGFDDFWAAYPRKVAKQAAAKAYAAALKRGAEPAELLTGVRRYAALTANSEPRFIAHPTTWLNQGRWEDEPDRPLRAAAGGYEPFRNPTNHDVYDEPLLPIPQEFQ